MEAHRARPRLTAQPAPPPVGTGLAGEAMQVIERGGIAPHIPARLQPDLATRCDILRIERAGEQQR